MNENGNMSSTMIFPATFGYTGKMYCTTMGTASTTEEVENTNLKPKIIYNLAEGSDFFIEEDSLEHCAKVPRC